LKIVIRTAAQRDILSQVAYLIDESAYDAALRFSDAVNDAIEQVRNNPEIGSPTEFKNPRLKNLRSWAVPGFEDIRVYYLQPDDKTLRVVRVLHGKRDLGRILEKEAK
jgi:plasmid stabilization system protein ParE